MTVDININTHCLLYVYAPILIKLFKNIIINNIILNHLHSFSYHYALPKCSYNNILLVTIMYLLMSYFHYPMYSFSLTCGSATECFVSQHAIGSQSFYVLSLLSWVNTECHCHGCDDARYKLCPAIVHYTNYQSYRSPMSAWLLQKCLPQQNIDVRCFTCLVLFQAILTTRCRATTTIIVTSTKTMTTMSLGSTCPPR